MNILHISALPIWSMDGKGGMPSLVETLDGHIRRGHHIHIIFPEYDLFSNDQNPLKLKNKKEYTANTAKCHWLIYLKRIRAKAEKVSKGKEIPYLIRWMLNVTTMVLLTFSLVREAKKVHSIEKFNPDIVYANNQYAALAGFILTRLWKIPNVTRLYGTFLADLMKKPFVFLRYPTAAAGYLVPSTLLICGNDGTRGDEVAKKFKINPRRFRFWQNGVSPPSAKPVLTREEFIKIIGQPLRKSSRWIVSCSRLSDWKKIDRILHALKVCVDNRLDCQLIVAGDGPEKESLMELSTKLGFSNEVIWLGSVDHDNIWTLMNLSDVFMITNDVTNRCNPLYEAAWAGLPVVSVVDPSTSDLLEDGVNALLAKKDDNLELGKKLLNVCKDENLRNRLGRKQKKLASTFWSWEERMIVEVEELEKIHREWKTERLTQEL